MKIMEIFIRDKNMPKSCCNCKNYYMNTADTYSCSEIDGGSIYSNFTDGNNRHPNCPLKSLDQHDAEVKKPLKDEIIRLKNYVIDINKNNNILREQLEKTCRNTFDPTKWQEEGYQKAIEELKKWVKKYPQVQEWDSIYNIARTYIHKEDLEQKLNELEGKKDE